MCTKKWPVGVGRRSWLCLVLIVGACWSAAEFWWRGATAPPWPAVWSSYLFGEMTDGGAWPVAGFVVPGLDGKLIPFPLFALGDDLLVWYIPANNSVAVRQPPGAPAWVSLPSSMTHRAEVRAVSTDLSSVYLDLAQQYDRPSGALRVDLATERVSSIDGVVGVRCSRRSSALVVLRPDGRFEWQRDGQSQTLAYQTGPLRNWDADADAGVVAWTSGWDAYLAGGGPPVGETRRLGRAGWVAVDGEARLVWVSNWVFSGRSVRSVAFGYTGRRTRYALRSRHGIRRPVQRLTSHSRLLLEQTLRPSPSWCEGLP